MRGDWQIIEDVFNIAIILLFIFVPLGIWKAVELIMMLIRKVM